MTNHVTDQTPDDNFLDRRSLLIKAAAVGAVAWTAPIIISSPALATSCTPKCAIQTFGTPQLIGVDACDTAFTSLPGYAGSALQTFIGNSNKMSVISIVAGSSTNCPCGAGGTPSVIIGSVPAKIPKVGSASQYSGACSSTSSAFLVDTFSLAGTGYVDPAHPNLTAANSFILGKSGAIGNGTFTLPSICVSYGCVDRNNQLVYTKQSFFGCFNYQPSGNCGTLVPVLYQFSPLGGITIGCNPC